MYYYSSDVGENSNQSSKEKMMSYLYGTVFES